MSATRHWVCNIQGTERAVDPSLSLFEYRDVAPAKHELGTTLSWLVDHGWQGCDQPGSERAGQEESFRVVATADASDETLRGTVAIFWHPPARASWDERRSIRRRRCPAAVEVWSRHLY
jgi:hypothetical protein